MRPLLLTLALLSVPATSFAQVPLQSITLTPQEYQQLFTALLQQHPDTALLLQKQQAAQEALAAKDMESAHAGKPQTQPKPPTAAPQPSPQPQASGQ